MFVADGVGQVAQGPGGGPHPAEEKRRRPAPVGEAEVEIRVPVEHSAVDEGGDRQGFLGGESDDQFEIEAAQPGIARRFAATVKVGPETP